MGAELALSLITAMEGGNNRIHGREGKMFIKVRDVFESLGLESSLFYVF